MQPTGHYRMSGDQRIYAKCPACGKRDKCYQSEETGAWLCFSCNARGKGESTRSSTSDLLAKFKPKPPHEWGEVDLPEWKPLSKPARRWLAGRGIHCPEQFALAELEETTRILIPYFGPEGKIIYWNTRSYLDDGKPKYMTAPGRHPLYIVPCWEAHYEEVNIVEGVFDAILSYLGTGHPAIALGGKTITSYNRSDLDSLAKGKRTVMLDPDALDYAFRLAKEIGGTIRTLPEGMDPADYYKERIVK